MKAFIIFRDRVTYGQHCAAALEKEGLDVHVVDHGSSWPPALAWLTELEEAGTPVLRRPPGTHPRALWHYPPFRAIAGLRERYLVTDPDVVPSDDCPPGWADQLSRVLDEFPSHLKAGLGLRLDRIPETYPRRDQVIEWENQFWAYPTHQDSEVFHAMTDTTLAVYQPLLSHPEFGLGPALRTGPPYLADHLSWYEDPANLTKELAYYHHYADPGIVHWTSTGRSVWDA